MDKNEYNFYFISINTDVSSLSSYSDSDNLSPYIYESSERDTENYYLAHFHYEEKINQDIHPISRNEEEFIF